jgi:RNA polymerase sigma-70 factor (ECF subfamily)
VVAVSVGCQVRVACDAVGCSVSAVVLADDEARGAAMLRERGWHVGDADFCPAHPPHAASSRPAAAIPTQRAAPAAGGEVDTAELRAAVVAGDAAAFEAMYRRYSDFLIRHLYYRCGDRQLAADLVQQTFLRGWARRDHYRETGRAFIAWLVTIAHNLLADHYKSGYTRLICLSGEPYRGYQLGDGDQELPLMWAASPQDPSVAVADGDAHARRVAVLAEAIQRLTRDQQEVVRLRMFEGLSVADTAAKMGILEGAVKALLYRAVRALRRNPQVAELRAELVS